MTKKLLSVLLAAVISVQLFTVSTIADETVSSSDVSTEISDEQQMERDGSVASVSEPEEISDAGTETVPVIDPDASGSEGFQQEEESSESSAQEPEDPADVAASDEEQTTPSSESELLEEHESSDPSAETDSLFQAGPSANFNHSYFGFKEIEGGSDVAVFSLTSNGAAQTELTIPETVKDSSGVSHKVTAILGGAFASASQLTSLTIPASVTKIESNGIELSSKAVVRFLGNSVSGAAENAIIFENAESYVIVPATSVKTALKKAKAISPSSADVVVKGADVNLADGYYYLVSGVGDGKSFALDVEKGAFTAANGANVDIYQYDKRDSEAFYIQKVNKKLNLYTITAYNSGKLIDVSGAGTENKTNVQMWGTAAGNARKFTITYTESGDGFVISPHYAGNMALDVASAKAANGQNVQIYKSNNSAAQTWHAEKASIANKTKGADAAVADGYYYLTSGIGDGKSYAMDINSGLATYTNGANIDIYEYDKRNSEIFYIKKVDSKNNLYTIASYQSGKLIDIKDSGSVNKTNVQTWNMTATKARKFKITWTGVGAGVTISPYYATDMVFDVYAGKGANGQNVQLYQANGSDAQTWRLQKVTPKETPAELKQGIYAFHTGISSKSSKDYTTRVFQVASGSLSNGANVNLYTYNDTNDQKFFVIPRTDLGSGYYTILNGKSRKSLDIKGAQTANKTNVQQYTSNKSAAQTWRIMVDSNGYYSLHPANSIDKCLDVNGAKNADSANVQIYTANYSNAQKWVLEPTTLKLDNDQIYSIVSKQNTAKAIDVAGASVENKALLNLWTASTNNWQKWKAISLGNGYYQLQNIFNGKCIDIPSNKQNAGVQLDQYAQNSTTAQKFKVYSTGDVDGSFYIETTGGLRVATEKTAANGVKLVLAKANNNSDAQKFIFNATTSENDLLTKNGHTVSYSYGVQVIKKWKDGNYFDDDGYLASGWTYLRQTKGIYTKGYWYYFKSKGDPVSDARAYMTKFPGVTTKTSRVAINRFDSAGNRVVELGPDGVHPTDEYYKTLTMPDLKYKFIVDREKCVVNIFAAVPGTSNYIIPVYAVYCSPGAPGTETDLGNYQTSNRTTYGYLMGPSWGQYTTHFNLSSGEFFHAVAGEIQNYHSPFVGSINALGTRQSHGCVRLSVRDAYWIYAYTPWYCPVVVTENYSSKVKVNPKASWDLIAKYSADPTDPWLTGNYGYSGN